MWICSEHFVSGAKTNNLLVPNNVSMLYKHVSMYKALLKESLKEEYRILREDRVLNEEEYWEEAEKDKLGKEAAIQLQLKEQEAKKELEEEAEGIQWKRLNWKSNIKKLYWDTTK